MAFEGTFTPPSALGQQYRRQSEDYSRALRLLRQNSRIGGPQGANAAMNLIKLRQDAVQQGFAPTGIRSAEDYKGAAGAFEQSYLQAAQAREGALSGMQQPQAGQAPQGQTVAPQQPVSPQMRLGGPPKDRLYSALDVLEGKNQMARDRDMGDYLQGRDRLAQGTQAAQQLGVPQTQIDALGGNDPQLKYRQLLDQALSEAKTPEEINALRERGIASGIKPEDFDRRAAQYQQKSQLEETKSRLSRGSSYRIGNPRSI